MQSHFSVIKELGRGAAGVVFLVRRRRDGRLFAAKEIACHTPEDRKAIMKEVHLLQSVPPHPNVIQLEEVVEQRGMVTVILEYALDGTLKDRVYSKASLGGAVSEEEAVKWIGQLVNAFEFIHAQGVVHRDIKLDNLFLTSGGQVVKIGDFGIATNVLNQGKESLQRSTAGTPQYMSPEMCEGVPYTSKTDVWSLGIVAYEICAEAVPFNADNLLGLVNRITKLPCPTLPTRFSRRLDAIVHAMLIKDAQRRPSMTDLNKMLKHYRQKKAAGLPDGDDVGGFVVPESVDNDYAGIGAEIAKATGGGPKGGGGSDGATGRVAGAPTAGTSSSMDLGSPDSKNMWGNSDAAEWGDDALGFGDEPDLIGMVSSGPAVPTLPSAHALVASRTANGKAAAVAPSAPPPPLVAPVPWQNGAAQATTPPTSPLLAPAQIPKQQQQIVGPPSHARVPPAATTAIAGGASGTGALPSSFAALANITNDQRRLAFATAREAAARNKASLLSELGSLQQREGGDGGEGGGSSSSFVDGPAGGSPAWNTAAAGRMTASYDHAEEERMRLLEEQQITLNARQRELARMDQEHPRHLHRADEDKEATLAEGGGLDDDDDRMRSLRIQAMRHALQAEFVRQRAEVDSMFQRQASSGDSGGGGVTPGPALSVAYLQGGVPTNERATPGSPPMFAQIDAETSPKNLRSPPPPFTDSYQPSGPASSDDQQQQQQQQPPPAAVVRHLSYAERFPTTAPLERRTSSVALVGKTKFMQEAIAEAEAKAVKLPTPVLPGKLQEQQAKAPTTPPAHDLQYAAEGFADPSANTPSAVRKSVPPAGGEPDGVSIAGIVAAKAFGRRSQMGSGGGGDADDDNVLSSIDDVMQTALASLRKSSELAESRDGVPTVLARLRELEQRQLQSVAVGAAPSGSSSSSSSARRAPAPLQSPEMPSKTVLVGLPAGAPPPPPSAPSVGSKPSTPVTAAVAPSTPLQQKEKQQQPGSTPPSARGAPAIPPPSSPAAAVAPSAPRHTPPEAVQPVPQAATPPTAVAPSARQQPAGAAPPVTYTPQTTARQAASSAASATAASVRGAQPSQPSRATAPPVSATATPQQTARGVERKNSIPTIVLVPPSARQPAAEPAPKATLVNPQPPAPPAPATAANAVTFPPCCECQRKQKHQGSASPAPGVLYCATCNIPYCAPCSAFSHRGLTVPHQIFQLNTSATATAAAAAAPPAAASGSSDPTPRQQPLPSGGIRRKSSGTDLNTGRKSQPNNVAGRVQNPEEDGAANDEAMRRNSNQQRQNAARVDWQDMDADGEGQDDEYSGGPKKGGKGAAGCCCSVM